ncbi:hypothetical protein FHW79_005316 [Azospirillum sp. OGB3]|uniref:FlhC family transcriptional regulator n=1 Tax=Azospirillum sp. OGB3 TaxID=2587012 RepID=UPI001606B61E|nr:FlhC family transcriptional regulator [Azospirillum sp. OGB3]MBB3267651.1 hypothetical protein [Azospirillum sp. OGB3]
MSRLSQHAQISLAIDLILFGVRTSIVQLHTGISAPILRALYREIYNGEAPVSGQMAESDGVVCTRQDVIEASLFLNLYVHIGTARVYRTINIEALIRSYKLFLELRAEAGFVCPPKIGPTEAWILVRDLRIRDVVSLRSCPCGCTYSVVLKQRLLPRCPACGADNEPTINSSESLSRIGRSSSTVSPSLISFAEEDDMPLKPQRTRSASGAANPS